MNLSPAPHIVVIAINFVITCTIVWLLRNSSSVSYVLKCRLLKKRHYEVAWLESSFIKHALWLFCVHSLGTLITQVFLLVEIANRRGHLDWPPPLIVLSDLFAIASLGTWVNVFQGTPRNTYAKVAVISFIVLVVDLSLYRNQSWNLLPSGILNVAALLLAIVAVDVRYPARSRSFRVAFSIYSVTKAPAYAPSLFNADAWIYYVLGLCELLVFLLLCDLLLGAIGNSRTESINELFRRPWKYFKPNPIGITLILSAFLAYTVILIVNQQILMNNRPAVVIGALVLSAAFFGWPGRHASEDITKLRFDPQFWCRFIRQATRRGRIEGQKWDFKETLDFWQIKEDGAKESTKGKANDEIKAKREAKLKSEVKFAESVAALANSSGGVLILGVKNINQSNNNWEIVGVKNLRALENWLKHTKEVIAKHIDYPFEVVDFRQVLVSDQDKEQTCIVVIVPQTREVVGVFYDGRWTVPVRQETGTSKRISLKEIYISKSKIVNDNYEFMHELRCVADGDCNEAPSGLASQAAGGSN